MVATATGRAAAEPAERVLVITRVYDAPRERVWDALTQPERLVHWWGPKGFTVPWHEWDIRPGGAYRVCIRSPEGEEYIMRGVYREVARPERLLFSFMWERGCGDMSHETVVTVTLAEEPEGTRLTFRQSLFETVEQRDSHNGGWGECLDRLASYLAEA